MIEIDKIKGLIEEAIAETGIFIVDVAVGQGNLINVFADKAEGITIEECVKISRHIEHSLDREEEDFELQVSSPGLDMPFKVEQQYEKNLNKEVQLQLCSGEKLKGVLLEKSEDSLSLEITRKEKVEGKKKKQEIKETIKIELKDIKSTKAVLGFK